MDVFAKLSLQFVYRLIVITDVKENMFSAASENVRYNELHHE